MAQKAYFYTVNCRSRFSATSDSEVMVSDRDGEWQVIEVSPATPGDEMTILGFKSIVPASASAVVKIGRENETEGFFFVSEDNEALGSAVLILESQNYLSISVAPII